MWLITGFLGKPRVNGWQERVKEREQAWSSGQASPGLRRVGRRLGTGPLEKLSHPGQGVGLLPQSWSLAGGGAAGHRRHHLQVPGRHGGLGGALPTVGPHRQQYYGLTWAQVSLHRLLPEPASWSLPPKPPLACCPYWSRLSPCPAVTDPINALVQGIRKENEK